MSEVLRIKYEKIETVYEIMEPLQAMFGQPSDQFCHDAFKTAMNTEMKAGTSVQEHQVKIHGAVIDELREKRKKNKSDLLFLEACLVEDDSSLWINDLGTTNHVFSFLQMLSSLRQLAEREFTLMIGTGRSCEQ